jgi:hypothetical protein
LPYEEEAAMKAGIAIYRRKGKSLSGQWTHEEIGGVLAEELVQDVAAGPMVGDWPVQVFSPDGSVSFTGRLRSVALGNSLLLTWDGNMADKPEQSAKFVGMGYQIDRDLMVASFEQTE